MDLIEKKAVIDTINLYFAVTFDALEQSDETYDLKIINLLTHLKKGLITAIETMPSAQPEREKGHWILDQKSGRRICSECLACASRDDFGKEYLSDYCGVCGADMRGEEDEID